MRLNDAGFTLAEVVVAGSLTALTAALALGALGVLQRVVQAQAERSATEAALRTGDQFLRSELGELSAGAGGDLLVLEPSQVRYRARRAFGLACGIGADGLLVRSETYRGARLPAPDRDSLDLVLPLSGAPPLLIRTAVAAAGRATTCPGGSGALGIPIPPGAVTLAVPDRSPVWVWEVMEIRAYTSSGQTWLGVRSVSAGEVIQPLFGPLASGAGGGGGLAFRYLDPDGLATSDPARVARIEVFLRVLANGSVALGGAGRALGGSADSLTLVIPLLNGARP